MDSSSASSMDVDQLVADLGPTLAELAPHHDRSGEFVQASFDALKEHRIFGAMVPTELGGGGMGHGDFCELLRRLAHSCGSSALALSMHSHLVATAVWKHKRGKGGGPLLTKVAAKQLMLVSTGAGDWLESGGKMERVEGGYRVTARKHFCSGSPAGAMMLTTARFEHPEQGPQVLHFPVAFSAEGVTRLDDWDTMGMRGTGSNSVLLENVFVPEGSIGLARPQKGWHPAWNVVLACAAPIYTSPYVGVAEAACELARKLASRESPHVPYLLGEMENELATAQMALREMVAGNKDFEFAPSLELTNKMLIRKTIASRACIAAVDKAMEAVGGSSIMRSRGLERRFRDVRAAPFHPLAEKPQTLFTGRMSMGLDPV